MNSDINLRNLEDGIGLNYHERALSPFKACLLTRARYSTPLTHLSGKVSRLARHEYTLIFLSRFPDSDIFSSN